MDDCPAKTNFQIWIIYSRFIQYTVHCSPDNIIALQPALLKMRRDNGLMVEPHPRGMIGFKASNPVVSEILKNGVEIKKH